MFANPILKSFKNFNIYLLCWLILALINFLLLYFGTDIKSGTAVADSFIFTILLGGLGLSLWYPARYIPLEQNKISKVLISHFIGAVITSVLWILIGTYFMLGIIGFTDNYETFIYTTLPWRFLIGILFYALITSFYYMIIYYTGFNERMIKEVELKNLVTEAELKSLKFQINPHFVFNSLNSISALTEIDPGKAKSMILKLADFLRFTLSTNDREKNKLSEELKNIRLYLDIEKVRFEEKFEYKEDIEEGCENVEVPNMLLQPLFENVIKHAVYETLDKVVLTLKCKRKDEFLRILIENDFDETSSPKKGTGVGLKNIYERLKLIYHMDNLMDVKKEKGKFSVTLFIPEER
ncbi:MAG: histidine kinase [Ignavibacteriae bacterium]|nr:MAG: histidine kinase [Ignavibacteriota bacterium]